MNRTVYAILGVVLIAVMVGGAVLLNNPPRDDASPPTDSPTVTNTAAVISKPTETPTNTPTPTAEPPLPLNALPTEEMLPDLVATDDLGGDQGCIAGCDSIDPPPSPPDS